MEINYNGKKFRVVNNSKNGEVSAEMIFEYKQQGNIVTSKYSGKKIKLGHLIGIVAENGIIEMKYHQINTDDKLMTGSCTSIPEILSNGKIRLHETWQWTSGDSTKGTSIIEEI